MEKQDQSWIDRLELMIQQKNMLTHPFYQAWTQGSLSKATLQDYAKEYYHHVKAFPRYISLLHSRCDNDEARKCLLDNLIDEEAGSPNHPDLWRSFTLALGVTEEELKDHQAHPQTSKLIEQFRNSCGTSSIAAGVAALYSYESQIPAICTTKIEGLKEWYGLNRPVDYAYFSLHEVADVEHSRREKELLMNLVKTPEEENEVLEHAEKVLTALWNFLTSIYERMCGEAAMCSCTA